MQPPWKVGGMVPQIFSQTLTPVRSEHFSKSHGRLVPLNLQAWLRLCFVHDLSSYYSLVYADELSYYNFVISLASVHASTH